MRKKVTSFSDAIFELLDRFGAALHTRGAGARTIPAYLFGGCAVYLHTPHRMSSDLDLEVDTALLPTRAIREAKEEVGYVLITSNNSDDESDLLELDLNYNSTLGPLHENFTDRARIVETRDDSPLVVLLPSKEDLALSKLGRLSEKDLQDILLLMGLPGANWELLERLVFETDKYYVAPLGDLTSKFRYVIRSLNR